MPVTAGGLVIREPNPRPQALECSASPTLSSEAAALIVRPASVTGWSDAYQSRSHRSSIILSLPMSNERPRRKVRPQVTVQSVTDEEAGPYRPTSPADCHVGYDPRQRASPESAQQDSASRNSAAQSIAQNLLQDETPFHSVVSSTAANTSNFSRNPPSIRRALREHTSRPED